VRSAHVNARCDDQDARTAHRRFGSDVLKAIDFSVPANEEFDIPVKRLVWLVACDRIFGPRRNTYDELLATGRIVVIDDPIPLSQDAKELPAYLRERFLVVFPD